MRRVLRRPLGAGSLAVIAILVLGCLLAPVLAPYSPTANDLDHVLSGLSGAHWLGTDGLGRDVLSRLMYGGRLAFLHALTATATLFAVGVTAGLVAGFFRGWADRVFGWVTDVMLAIPALVVLLSVLAMVGHNMTAAMVALGVLASPGVARVVRGSTLAVRQELYVAAARVSGLPNRHIVVKHVLPRVLGPVIVQLSLALGGALLIDAGLSYLGFGPQPPTPTWGGMLTEAASVINQQAWLLVPPGVTIGLAIMAFGLLGDVVRDATAERSARTAVHVGRPPARLADAAAPPSDGGLLALRDVAIALPNTVVEDLTLDIAPGETVGLVGESGCGKSITGRAILGLLPAGGHVTAGHIWFDGVDLAGAGTTGLRRIRGKQIALVSQEPLAALDPVFTAGQQVDELVRRHHGGSRAAVRARTLRLFADVNLPDPEAVAGRYPHELSGGMAQRVALAMALAGEPRLLIADEPTTALDVTVQAEILDLLRRLQAERGMAVLLISHDWGVVADMCQRAYVMYAGHVVETGDVTALFDQPMHPYTAGLLASTPRRSLPREHLAAIAGTVPDPAHWPAGCHFAPRCPLATPECTQAPIPLLEPATGHRTRCIHYTEVGGGDQHEPELARRA
jgi:peptide/nickel transport system permease protein